MNSYWVTHASAQMGSNQWDVGLHNHDFVFRQMLLPDIRAASGSEFLVFSRTVPHYIAPKTHSVLLYQEMPDFIPPIVSPPNLLDLNPVDYTMWSVLQEQVYRTKVSDVDELKRRIISKFALSHTDAQLSSSGISIRKLQADILSTCCNKDDLILHM